ncbi:putative transposase, mutator type, MULE transposase domain protein [Tanacetum coccineum]
MRNDPRSGYFDAYLVPRDERSLSRFGSDEYYDNAPNMFSIRIHHGGKFRRYPWRMYVSGHVDIFDMVDIDLPLTSLDEGLYALACEEDFRCLATLVRSFKLIEVYIEHGVTALDSYIRPPRFRATIEEITDEPGSIAPIEHRSEFFLLLTWHDSGEQTEEPVCESVTPRSLPEHDSSTPCKDSVCESVTPRCMPYCMLNPPSDESVITYTQLRCVQGVDTQYHVLSTIQSQFSGINLSFADVARSGVESSSLSHNESFGLDDLDSNFNEPVNLNVSQIETQSELSVSDEPDVGRSQEPIMVEVRTQEPIVEDVIVEDCVSSGEDAEQGNGQFFYYDEGIDIAYETKYDVQSSEDAGTDDDDEDEDFLVDEENEIVEPDVDVHLFGISMDVPFDNIGVTNLVPDDVLEGEDVDVINADGFDSDPSNDNETSNYRRRMLAELSREIEGVINASGQWKYSFYIGQKFTTAKEVKDILYLYSIESRRNLKLYKNDSIRIRARCDGKVHVFTMSQGTGPIGPNRGMEAGPSGSSGPNAHDKGDLCPWVLVNPDIPVKALQDQPQRDLEYFMLRDYVVELQSTNPNTTVKIAVERSTDPSLPTRGPFPGQVLTAVGLDSNNRIYPLAYALVEAEMIDKSIWEALGGNTRDLDLIWEETGQDCNFTLNGFKDARIVPGDGDAIPSDPVRTYKPRRQNVTASKKP